LAATDISGGSIRGLRYNIAVLTIETLDTGHD
jgi:hypothetical protein